MAQWKQQLHKDMRSSAHVLNPITRVSPRTKGQKLSTISNTYTTGCKHCSLSIKIETEPGTVASATFTAPGHGSYTTELPLTTDELESIIPTCTTKRFYPRFASTKPEGEDAIS